MVVECHSTSFLVSTHGQHQRVDDHILGRDAQLGSPFQDFSRDLQAHLRIGGDAIIIHRQTDHRCTVFLDDRQQRLPD